MKKIIFIILMTICSCLNVKAKEGDVYSGYIYADDYLNGIYIKMTNQDGNSKHFNARINRRSTDQQFIYCLEPFASINSQSTYQMYENNIPVLLNISQKDWNRIIDLAYYGYGYKDTNVNHEDEKWSIITQMLIWQTIDKESNIYFTDKPDGKKIELFSEEIEELERLVNKHYDLPTFNNMPNKLIQNQTYLFSDENKILSEFQVLLSSNLKTSIIGNSVQFRVPDKSKGYVNIVRKTNTSTKPIVYLSDNSQIVMSPGTPTQNIMTLSFTYITPSLKITSVDESNHELLLPNTTYGVYDENNTKITTMTTDSHGTANFQEFTKFGTYYILEEVAPLGYKENTNKYYFTIDADNYQIELKIPSTKITGQIKVIKTDSETKETPQGNATLIGAKYHIYNENNELIEELIINESHTAISQKLEYGKYYIQEVEAPKGYLIDPTIHEVMITIDNLIYEVFSQEQVIKGSIQIVKIDEETQQPIAGTIISIYDSNNNIISTNITDDNGQITINDIPYGNYYLKEEQPSIGYLLSNKILNFFIEKDQEKIELIHSNKQVPEPEMAPVLPDIELKEESSEPPIVDEPVIKIEIPNTALSEIDFYKYVILLLMGIVIIYAKKN